MAPYRIMYWRIENVWIFYVLAGLSTGIFLTGVAIHIWVWKKNSGGSLNIPFSKEGVKKTILDTFLGRRVLQNEISAGIMHLFLFWGFLSLFIGTAILSVHHWVISFLKGTVYLVFSFAMEIGGIMLLTGIIWALIRRYIQRVPRLERRLEDALVSVWLLLAVFSGFMLEGLRLTYHHPSWSAWSFAGQWMGALFSPSTAEAFYPYFWWGHALLSLSFIAVIPFTKLFHIIGAPVSIYIQESVSPVIPDIEDEIGEFNTEFNIGDSIFFDACMRCGRCVASCPSAGAGEPFSPRDFVQAMHRGLWQKHFPLGDIRFLTRHEETKMDENFWYCTTCRACLEVCPVYGATFEAVIKKRALAVEEGTHVPKLLNQTLEKVFNYDNPWESSKRRRGEWAKGLDLVDLAKRGAKADLCYFVGCTTSFDDTAQGMALSFSKILQTAGVSFGILGKKEPCCGDIARRVGELGLFSEQMDNCLELFKKYNISDIVTSSPHCFHTFRNEYPKEHFRARHYTLVLQELMDQGKLSFKKGMTAKVTFHDPCYLGRYNRIFDEPRQIIRSIPGVHLVEMAHHGADSLCCGGGGGRMWQDLAGEVKMGEIRIREAEATGAQILITACPLCRIMLEDARKVAGLNETLRVMDLNELVLQALEGADA
ncbi:MAG: respiratory nitrate reductase subunit gamma [Desulfobacula sp.]|uniref:heterodisulfide reductase-related iron-sulfur binding cluster n=1 Tax=Desulfobacula sp. TaxID=2593537 RepID=UPI0025C06673|nr:heterodisulfide reductase-related iron-sulfur binding cluster [Desulfobacula sp.]MCD4720546.1 respiratory nitrate reductase subunit gamma [Desulfobacula sp.]